jgi:hypothetical protein
MQTKSASGEKNLMKQKGILRESPIKNVQGKKAEDLAKSFNFRKSLSFASPMKSSSDMMNQGVSVQ